MKTLIPNLFLALAWLALPTLAQAQFSFTTNNGAITITGYNTAAGLNAVIPASTNGWPVISIGNYAFFGSSITNVTIPNSVTSIGVEAFVCHSLRNITVAASDSAYSSLGGVLFDKAKATLIQFPAGLGGGYIITNSVTSIGVYAFYACTNLFNVTITNSVTSIGLEAFEGCSSLTNVTIPNSVTTIGEYAFEGCSGLTSITIPEGVATLGTYAFNGCTSLVSISIPNSVTSFGTDQDEAGNMVAGCTSLKAITVGSLNPNYSSLGDVLFNKNQTLLLEYPPGLSGTYTIPGSVKTIGVFAFDSCPFLTGVVIPASVTSINDSAFFGCAGLASVTIPNTVTSFGAQVFSFCSSLTTVTVGSGVRNIGADSFQPCPSLTAIYFEGNAPGLGDPYVFIGDTATVYYLAGTTGWYSTYGGLPTVMLNAPSPISGIGVQNGLFGFTFTGTNTQVFVVEASTNLANPNWQPLQTNTLTGTTFNFTDSQWENYPRRFYRIK